MDASQNKLHDVAQRVHEINLETVAELAQDFRFAPEPSHREIDQAPLVLIVGNHSSGKSSFINHLLGERIQRTAVAPMDDGFSLLTYGETSQDVDGKAVVSHRKWSYDGLQDFGPTLVSHLVMKQRPCELLRTLTLVDSPGMIDARVEHDGRDQDRGYDFCGVVRWFAERADVILLFFDPDNPGTTGETLQILNEALRDMDHKLELIMNKVDRFPDHHDFARGYGALCWNLARAIPRLDLPHINLIYVKGHDRPRKHLPLEDFDRARDQVIEAIEQAPTRRVDNVISRVYEFSRGLRVHSQVCEHARARWSAQRWRHRGLATLALTGASVAGLVCWTLRVEGSWSWLLGALVAGVLALGFIMFLNLVLRRAEEDLTRSLGRVFDEAFAEELALGSNHDDLKALWQKTRPRTETVLQTVGLKRTPKLKKRDRERLKSVIDEVLPALRAEIHKSAPPTVTVSPEPSLATVEEVID